MNHRINSWLRKTGVSRFELEEAARRAAKGYNGGEPTSSLYSSGYQAGETESHLLPDGSRSSDRRIRAFGDFLIDFGETMA